MISIVYFFTIDNFLATNELEDSIIGAFLGIACGDMIGLSVKLSGNKQSSIFAFSLMPTITK